MNDLRLIREDITEYRNRVFTVGDYTIFLNEENGDVVDSWFSVLQDTRPYLCKNYLRLGDWIRFHYYPDLDLDNLTESSLHNMHKSLGYEELMRFDDWDRVIFIPSTGIEEAAFKLGSDVPIPVWAKCANSLFDDEANIFGLKEHLTQFPEIRNLKLKDRYYGGQMLEFEYKLNPEQVQLYYKRNTALWKSTHTVYLDDDELDVFGIKQFLYFQ